MGLFGGREGRAQRVVAAFGDLGVAVQEQQGIAGGAGEAAVDRGAETACLGIAQPLAGVESGAGEVGMAQELDAGIGRAVVDHDDFERCRPAAERREAPRREVAAVVHRDDHRNWRKGR